MPSKPWLDSDAPTAALLVDLSKAFERVNPYWILHILRMRGAPTWVCNYAKYVLFGRLIRHKVQGRLLPPRAVYVGVDMGRSFSVFLFCLAMDPIYHYLNRIPRVLSVQGYIDDNTIAGPGNDIEWVHGVQNCYQLCRTAGFQIDPHSCWQAVSSDCPPFATQMITERQENQSLLQQPRHPTSRSAILAAILPRKTLILSRAGKCIGLTPREASRILNGLDYSPISSLLALECECRCKTALVINSPLPSWVLRQLDQAGFGAHCVQGVATSLGLLLLGRSQLDDKELWRVTTHPSTLKQINPKAAEKFVHRLRLFRQPVLSVVSRSIAFNTFSQSVVLYTTSYFGAATEDLRMLRAAAAELLLGRSWIRHDLLAYVLRWSKISPLLDPGLSILVSALGLFLRKGGGLHELYSEYPPPVNRQTHEVRALWQAWSRVVGEDLLTTAASSSGTVKQRINAVKTLILRHMMQVASGYIHNKVLASGWTGGISWSWLSQAITASKRWIPSMARFTLLRWAVNEDDDDWLARRGISRSRGCAFCANTGRSYPFGGCQVAICENCISLKQITAFTVDEVEVPVPRGSTSVRNQETAVESGPYMRCIACTKGDNTVGHWIRWCKVPIVALRNLTNDTTISSLLEGSRKSMRHLAIATRVVHQYRLLLREAGAMRHQVAAPPIATESWIANLTQKVYADLPSDLRLVHVRTQQVNAVCSLDDSNLACQDKSPLHISCTLAPARICSATKACHTNQTVGVVQLGSEAIQLIQQSIQVGIGISPNVTLNPYRCGCGEFHCKITALVPIGPEDVLCSNIQQEAGTLIIQFDGSCHADKEVGGAGAALLELQTHGLTLLRWRALALPKCPDNIFAEAMSANLGTDLLCEELVQRKFSTKQIYMQGDILPIIKHLAFAGRFRRIDLQPIVQQIRRKQSKFFDFGTWMYRPREANIIADHLAGIASRAAYELPNEQSQPIEVPTPAPYHMAMQAGAVVLDERPSGDTILLLTELPSTGLLQIRQFLMKSDYERYRREIEAYLVSTANLTQPRLVEYMATSLDNLGRLYGRGPCAQRLPRTVRLLLFGRTHQEVDMTGSFYEIMRRLSQDPLLPHIVDLRKIINDLLGLVPHDQRQLTIKRHPLIVMNAGASLACAKLERDFGFSCPTALLHLSAKIESATRAVVATHLPRLRPRYHSSDRGATFRVLEWYEEYVMLTFYKELTRRVHLKSVIWLHDGLWIPKGISLEAILTAERVMLQQLQLEQTPLFRIKDLSTETNEIVDTLGEVCPNQTHGPVLPDGIGRVDPIVSQGGSRIRWNTQAQSTGYATFVERIAKRRRKSR